MKSTNFRFRLGRSLVGCDATRNELFCITYVFLFFIKKEFFTYKVVHQHWDIELSVSLKKYILVTGRFSELLLPDDDVRIGGVGLAEPGQRRDGAGSLVVLGGVLRAAFGIRSLPDVPPVDVAATAG